MPHGMYTSRVRRYTPAMLDNENNCCSYNIHVGALRKQISLIIYIMRHLPNVGMYNENRAGKSKYNRNKKYLNVFEHEVYAMILNMYTYTVHSEQMPNERLFFFSFGRTSIFDWISSVRKIDLLRCDH